jgi:hypothetical protein
MMMVGTARPSAKQRNDCRLCFVRPPIVELAASPPRRVLRLPFLLLLAELLVVLVSLLLTRNEARTAGGLVCARSHDVCDETSPPAAGMQLLETELGALFGFNHRG